MKFRLFIGSSSEHLDYAESVQLHLSHIKNLDVICWKNIFQPMHYPLEDLLIQLEHISFGVFVLGPDDYIYIRDKDYFCTRDNVVFEMGMFIGALGRERTFFIAPSDTEKEYRIPSDLKGINYETYSLSNSDEKDVAVDAACTRIKRSIQVQMKKILPKDIIEKYGVFTEFDCLYRDFFSGAQKVTTYFIHSRRWRETNLVYIEQYLERDAVHWDVILPDITDRNLVSQLKKHFSDGNDIVTKVVDAYNYFNGLAKKYPQKIEIRLFNLYPVYTFYKFDNKMVISLYPLTTERRPTPTFLIDVNAQYSEFFKDDVTDILLKAQKKSPIEIDEIIRQKRRK